MASESLYAALAEALSKPSRASREAQAGIGAIDQGIEGYRSGAKLGDEIRKRKIQRQTLAESLGGNVPPPLSEFGKTSTDEFTALAPAITAAASLERATRERHEAKTPRLQQGQFQYDGMLTRFNPDPVNGGYEALTPEGWKPIGAPKAPVPGSAPSGSVPTGGTVSPRIPPTTPSSESDFFSKSDTLKGIFNEINATFKPEYVGPVQARANRAIDVYSPWGEADRSRFRNQVAKVFNNLIYLRSGKAINDSEAERMAEEFMSTNNSEVAFKSALGSMQDEMNSLAANRRKALVQSGYRGASGLGDQSASTPFGGAKVPTYATEQEAEASGYKGPAIIAGHPAVIQ